MIYIAHGYRSKRHVEWVENARSTFEAAGYPVLPVTYGYTRLWNVRRRTISNAERLAQVSQPGSVGIGHSNGCELLLRAARKTNNIRHLFFINPALRPNIEIPDSVHLVEVFYAPNDSAVVFGKWWRRANPVGWFGDGPMWGTMGREGYIGDDSRVINYNMGDVGHSGALSWDRGSYLWNFITGRIEIPCEEMDFTWPSGF